MVGPISVQADELNAAIASQLSMPIVDSGQALQDVRRFAAARIARTPQISTLDAWQDYAQTIREATLNKVVFRGAAEAWRRAATKVELLDTIEGGPGYQIRKLRLEVLPDMWIPALLYVPEHLEGKVPVFLNVNGHDPVGKAADYKQARCIHMAKNGIMSLNLEWFGMGQLATTGFAHGRLNQIDLCGASGLAPFFLAMSRGLDFLLSLENADPDRVGVAGLSGGGWQTILISSLDTRVTLCNPVAGYSSFRTRIDNFSDLGDSEQTPVDLGITADYSQLTALLAPRAALLTYNEKDDCCFASGHALEPLVAAATPVYELFLHESRFRTHINSDPGTHNFLLDNRQALYRMIRDQWFAGDDQAFPTTEIAAKSELKSAEALSIPLPLLNIDFQKLAMSLAETLPRSVARPTNDGEVERWRTTQIQKLRDVVRAAPQPESVTAEQCSESTIGERHVRHLKLRIGEDWLVPAVEFSKGSPAKVALVICDEGRKSAADHVTRLTEQGYRVIALDPFYFGECSISERGYLWALMISTVGERPIGIQAGQILSVAAWIHQTSKPDSVLLVADGPRSSVIGLIVAALNRQLISSVEDHRSLETLKQLVLENRSFEQSPEQFCFGLLEVIDIPQLREVIRQ
jgi:hypothetical protein